MNKRQGVGQFSYKVEVVPVYPNQLDARPTGLIVRASAARHDGRKCGGSGYTKWLFSEEVEVSKIDPKAFCIALRLAGELLETRLNRYFELSEEKEIDSGIGQGNCENKAEERLREEKYGQDTQAQDNSEGYRLQEKA